MHGNKACCEDVYQTAATVSILVLVICFASTQRTDGQLQEYPPMSLPAVS